MNPYYPLVSWRDPRALVIMKRQKTRNLDSDKSRQDRFSNHDSPSLIPDVFHVTRSNNNEGYSHSAFRMTGIPSQPPAQHNRRLSELVIIERLGWYKPVNINPTSFQYSDTSFDDFLEPNHRTTCRMNESRWIVTCDLKYSEWDILKSHLSFLYHETEKVLGKSKLITPSIAIMAYVAYTNPTLFWDILINPLGMVLLLAIFLFLMNAFAHTETKFHRTQQGTENGFYLSRNKGVIKSPWGEFPFYEFDAYLIRPKGTSGDYHCALKLVHRYPTESMSPEVYQPLEFTLSVEGGVAQHKALWDMLCRYMDITYPLPDIPELEPFRRLDPTTEEVDATSGRDCPLSSWKEFYSRDGWQELKEARERHSAEVESICWGGRKDYMEESVPDYSPIKRSS